MHLGQVRAVLAQVSFRHGSVVGPTVDAAARDRSGMTPAATTPAMGRELRDDELTAFEIQGVACDSRRVRPGDLFVAIPGHMHDGSAFAPEAVQRGAVAILALDPRVRTKPATAPDETASSTRSPLPVRKEAVRKEAVRKEAAIKEAALGVPVGYVPDPRAALARLAHHIEGRPAERMPIVGVTGTNGKTTTSKMAQAVLRAAGRSPAYVGTVGYEAAGRAYPAVTTTPESIDLARLFAEAERGGDDSVVMEVSSHALDQGRVAEIPFAAAVFTNLERDHQDYHGSMEAYFAAKRKLFDRLAPGGIAAIHVGDSAGARLAAELDGSRFRVVPFAAPPTDTARVAPVVTASRVDVSLDATRFRLHTPDGHADVACPLPGMFNVANALAAAAVGVGFGIDPETIARALTTMEPVPGRMERIGGEGGPTVIVDYAHSHSALDTALRTLAPLRRPGGRLHVVFGCGGGKDPGRRARMGRVAAGIADAITVTSDNPRREEPRRIIEDILTGVGSHGDVRVEPNRRAAIRAAIVGATPQDTVVIAGKGHEPFQELKDTRIPFDDRHEARLALARRDAELASSAHDPTMIGA